jgi:hypothetical protein
MPQSWEHWWPLPAGAEPETATRRDRILHTIGNLTLLKEQLNERLSNAPWTTTDSDGKRSSLQQHGLMRLNSMLTHYDHWDESTILDRSERLLTHALRIWARPGDKPSHTRHDQLNVSSSKAADLALSG